jgi:hypothetical protein
MTMPFFMEITPLYDLKGRQNYISSADKQEEIVIQSPAVDFSDVIVFNQNNKKNEQTWSEKQKSLVEARVIEGFEIAHSLPNQWYYDFKSGKMPEGKLRENLDALTEKTLTTKRTNLTGQYPAYQYAAHFNKKGDAKKDNEGNPTGEYYASDNFNLHIIFMERTAATEKNVYSRNIYMSVDGKATSVRSKAHILPTGTPAILHHKGESKGNFSSKDPEYNSKPWYRNKRKEVKSFWKHDLGIELGREYVYFHQYKHGKGPDAPEIKRKNKLLLEADMIVEEFVTISYTFPPKRLVDKTNPAFLAFLAEVTKDEDEKDMRAIVEKYGVPPAPAAVKAVEKIDELYNFDEEIEDFSSNVKVNESKREIKVKSITEQNHFVSTPKLTPAQIPEPTQELSATQQSPVSIESQTEAKAENVVLTALPARKLTLEEKAEKAAKRAAELQGKKYNSTPTLSVLNTTDNQTQVDDFQFGDY